LGDSRAVEPLAQALKDDESVEVRKKAAEALGELGDPRAVEPLAKALKDDESVEVREEAAEALGELGDSRAVEPLAQALKDDESVEVRKKAAEALGELGDSRAIEPLAQALKDSDSESVRIKAVKAFDKLGDLRAVEPLSHALGPGNSPTARQLAVMALGNIGGYKSIEVLINALRACKDDVPEDNKIVMRIILEIFENYDDKRMIDPLIELCSESNQNAKKFDYLIINMLSKLPGAVEPLIEALNKNIRNEYQARIFAEILSNREEEAATQELLNIVNSDYSINEAVLKGAKWAILKSREPEAIVPMLKLLARENSASTVNSIIKAIKEIVSPNHELFPLCQSTIKSKLAAHHDENIHVDKRAAPAKITDCIHDDHHEHDDFYSPIDF
jgi:HEAT repeat protein